MKISGILHVDHDVKIVDLTTPDTQYIIAVAKHNVTLLDKRAKSQTEPKLPRY